MTLVPISVAVRCINNMQYSCLNLENAKVVLDSMKTCFVPYGPGWSAGRTQFDTLCPSFITCSMSSDFMGGLEYRPESSPCPSLALPDKNKEA